MIRLYAGTAPLVLDSPHSGVAYPADFGHCLDAATLRRAEDTHVEKLYDFSMALGASWVEALFPRSYIDVNRSLLKWTRPSSPMPGPVHWQPMRKPWPRYGWAKG